MWGRERRSDLVKPPSWIKSLGKEWREMAAARRPAQAGCSRTTEMPHPLSAVPALACRAAESHCEHFSPFLFGPWCPHCCCPCGQRLGRGYACRVFERRWGHMLPAFCKLCRLLGSTSLLPHLGKLRDFKTGLWGLRKLLDAFVSKSIWCTFNRRKKQPGQRSQS